MNPVLYWSVISLCAVATYLTRLPAIWMGRRIHVTPRLKRGLDSIPIGVFAAMVLPTIAHQSVSVHGVSWPFIGATVVALVIALWTKNPLWTMLCGVIAIAGLRLL